MGGCGSEGESGSYSNRKVAGSIPLAPTTVCWSAREKDTEPQTAPDVQFGTLQPRVISVRMGECDTCLNSVIENDCSDVEKKNF